VISLWNLSIPAQPQLFYTLHGHSDRVLTLAFDPQGNLLASGGADRTLCLWEMHKHEPLHRLVGHSGWIMTVAISPDGRTIASGGFDESIRLWDSGSGVCHTILRSPRLYEGLNISGVTGIGDAEKKILKRLGAVEL
jgi:WD40 repeat protein